MKKIKFIYRIRGQIKTDIRLTRLTALQTWTLEKMYLEKRYACVPTLLEII